jgi:hypothetical protein
MDIDRAVVLVVVLFPLLVLGGGAVGALLWKLNLWNPSHLLGASLDHGQRDRLADDVMMVGVWIALTTASLWAGAFLAYFTLHALYFWLGSGIAAAGLVIVAAALLAVPFAWAVVIRRQLHRMHAPEPRGQQVGGHRA